MASDYQKSTVASPSRFKRFSHGARIDLALRLLDPRAGDRILDYGAGDGGLLQRLHDLQPAARLCGFEPRSGPETTRLVERIPSLDGVYDSMEPVESFRPNKIACLEVLEHLRSADQAAALADFERVLVPGGRVVVSVPIEIGPPALFKNVIRVAVDQPHRGITARNVALSVLGLTSRVERDEDEPYIASHVGFDYRDLRHVIRESGFSVETRYSPFRLLGPLLNSQVFFVLRPERERRH
jgi:2-polyprenyl-3-methyl-5-hydroxy-6-metoxy-1,4-benzoquinol methylase